MTIINTAPIGLDVRAFLSAHQIYPEAQRLAERSRPDRACAATVMTYTPSFSRRRHSKYTPRSSPRELYDSIIFALPSSSSQSPQGSFAKDLPSPWMTGTYDSRDFPSIRVQNSEYSFSHPIYFDQSLYNPTVPQPMYQNPSQNNLGTASSAFPNNPYAFNRGHKRQASDSTIASNGPDSPYAQTTAFPYIVGNDQSPTTAGGFYTDNGSSNFTKPRSQDQYQQFSVGYMPSQLSHTPTAHSALREMAIDQNASVEDVPDFASSRQSVSTHGRNTPTTPRTGVADELDDRPFKVPSNGEHLTRPRRARANEYSQDDGAEYRAGPRVELYRTESAACQDELFNPENFMSSNIQQPTQKPQVQQNNLLSPHRNLVSERIRTANSVRSQSPVVQTQRDRSPFRRGSPLAPVAPDDFRSTGPTLSTAEGVRRQQREQASAQEYARHQPPLKREETKTISPKDAVLDYNDTDQDTGMSMFHDTIPSGYQRHFGGTETFANNFVSGTNQAFGQFAPQNQQNLGAFRSADGTANFNFMPSPAQMPANYNHQQFKSVNNGMAEQTPEFPAHLTSMESSVSDNPPASSQESAISPVMRPTNTSADTGTYTCTYIGCAQRFESAVKLQKHKRDAHPSLQHPQLSGETSSQEGSTSPTSSPDPTGSGLTSSALLARNSQAGPHKCSRINPSTGKPCNTIFSRPYDLTRHEDTIHNRGKQKVRCQYCREEKTFSRNDALTRHMRVVHPEIDFQGKRGRRDY